MVLKSLELQGFKSFPDKTKVDFNRGLTAVVGPNGSGKSNISDAVRWVMGEMSTKSLRGERMEDVIFSGTKTRKAVSFACVSLTVDNKARELAIDSDEVTITRKLYRAGESEYLINGAQVRLRDVNEIFMDTGLGKDGYSIIGQGKIAQIVESKNNDRRDIFEEAAGISKFRYRKNESERKLCQAEDNLIRLRDILAELEARIAPLKEQSQKATKFLELAAQKKTLELSIWMNTLDKANISIKEQDDNLLIMQNRQEAISDEIQTIEDNIATTYEKMQKCLVDAEQKREQKEETDEQVSQFNSQIAVFENDILHNKSNIERAQNDIDGFSSNHQNSVEEIEKKQEQISLLTCELEKTKSFIETKQNELCLITSSEDDNTQKVNELNLTLNKMVLQQSQLAMNVASAKMSQQEISEEIQKNTEELQQKSHDLESYKRELDDANELLKISCEKKDASYNSCNGYKLKLESKRKTYEERKAHLDTLILKIKENEQSQKFLQNLEQNLEGYAYSVKEIIKRAKNKVISGVLGTVSQIINVSNEYSLAIETALGAAIQNIVVENETTAKNAIRVLKQENLGRATFLPLTSVSSSQLNISSTEQYPGFIGVASSLVKAEEKFKPIVDSLLCRIVVVDDIDTAVLIAQKNSYRFKIVTLDGQVVNAGGSLTGGSKGKQQGLLSRKNEIEELFRQTQKMILQKKEEENTCSQLLEELNLVNAEFVALQSEMQTFSEDTIRFEGEKKRLEQIHLQTQQLVKSMNEELLNKQNRITSLIKQQEDAVALLKQSESETLLATQQLELIKGSQLEFSTKRNELGVLLSDNKIKTIEISKDIQGLQNEMQGILQRQQQGKETLQKLENEKNELANANDLIMEKIAKCQLDVSEKQILSQNITIEIEKLYKKRNELEGETTALRKTEKEFSEEKEKIISQSVRYEERKNAIQKEYDEIIGKLWEEYELTRSEAAGLAVSLEDIPKSTASLNSVKTKIRALGSVNVAAIEEYKEVSCRYEYLFAQIKDIESAKLELTRLITELTQQMKELFSDSFAKINDNFSKIFVDLFGGGKAQLRLTEPENVLESGIEIIVEPPGKIIKNLSMLSGGEQTFIAIAIYFAILKVRPAPFCMLDEIEAALDDVNVVKYATYLRQLTDKTQFILITHRRGTMEEADILYGVTMQEEGVSKLLTLKVTEIEQKLGMKEKDS